MAPLTVSQLAARITQAVDAAFPERLTVIGEVSRLTDRTHLYFRLKDEAAVIEAICYRSDAARLSVRPRDGDQVIAKGRVGYWAEGGRLSLRVESMEPVGAGGLDATLRALIEDLRKRGWLDPALKRPLPSHPTRIAIITSRTGAALQDCLATARARLPSTEILVVDVRVQGAGAEREIAAAVRAVDHAAARLGIDALILTRGGGSIEDLWCFNEEIVAAAIHEATLPIVAAIGHEIDTTVADLVADHRAATPTAAVMALLPDRAALREELNATSNRMRLALSRHFATRRQALEAVASRPALTDPANSILRQREGLVHWQRAMLSAATTLVLQEGARFRTVADRWSPMMMHRLESLAGSLETVAGRLAAVDPMSVLDRGYAIVRTEEGRVVARAENATSCKEHTILWADGERTATMGERTPKTSK